MMDPRIKKRKCAAIARNPDVLSYIATALLLGNFAWTATAPTEPISPKMRRSGTPV